MLLRRARQENQRGGRERESGSDDAGCWARQRGATLWSGLAILAGGFPGCASSGGRLRKAALTLTDRALIANANRPDGFALPLAAVRQIGTTDDAPGDGPAVVVRYGDGADARTFAIRPAPARRGRTAEAMGGLLAALAATGWAAAPTPAPIDLTRSWGDARAAGSENILW
ncbi:MAG: hypothetical protein IT337_08065, partial [Thermomicrobiales bacterium]|nr:hypothetical protein [Thermomicrobiales bacterium]